MSDIELKQLFNFHQSQAVEATDHISLYCDLIKYLGMDEYKHVQINYNAAWYMIAKASLNSAINIICKLYDQEKSAMSLKNLLVEIKNQKDSFCPQGFIARCADKSMYHGLAQRCIYPGDDEVDKDIQLVTNLNAKVNTLTIWRNNYYSHYSREIVQNADQFSRKFSIDKSLLWDLLNQCCSILDKYQNIYIAETWSHKSIGHNTLLHMLDALKIDCDKEFA